MFLSVYGNKGKSSKRIHASYQTNREESDSV